MQFIVGIFLFATGAILASFFLFCNAIHIGVPASDIGIWKAFAEVYGPLSAPMIGILGFAGIILTIKSQAKLSKREQSHGYAIELMKFFSDMRKEISTDEHSGAMSFKGFLSDWFAIYSIVRTKLKPVSIDEIKSAIDVAYIFFFFGPNEKADSYFKQMDPGLLKEIHDEISRSKIKKADGTDQKRFRGNQDQLGQYSRFLYNSFEYIYKNENFDDAEKKSIGKLFRATLSSQELALLALNCQSQLGNEWISSGMQQFFQLPKNIPEFYFVREGCGFTISELYPNINYEWSKSKNLNPPNNSVPPGPPRCYTDPSAR